VDGFVLEHELFGVHSLEPDIEWGRCAVARELDHAFRNVGAENGAVLADRLRRPKADQAGSASDVEHAIPRSKVRHLQQPRLRRLELRLPRVFVKRSRLVPAVPLNSPLQPGFHGYSSTRWMRTSRTHFCARRKTSR